MATEPGPSWQRVVALIAAKDLRVERRSRMVLLQVLPFAVTVMVLFAFALDSDPVLQRVAPGLIWLATLFSMLVLVQRSYAVETADGALDALRLAGVSSSATFVGKTLALAGQLLVIEIVLVIEAIVLYNVTVPAGSLVLLVTTVSCATLGLSAVGILYGGLAAGRAGRETLLPLLVLPVTAPILIGATRATEAAVGAGAAVTSDGWAWMALLTVVAAIFALGGAMAFGPLIEE